MKSQAVQCLQRRIRLVADQWRVRGAVLGYLVWALENPAAPPGTASSLASLGSALVYALATRLGAPGRDKYMLVLALLIVIEVLRARGRVGDSQPAALHPGTAAAVHPAKTASSGS